MPRKKVSHSGSFQDCLDAALKDVTAPAALLPWLIEMKLRKARVRLTQKEREQLQRAYKTYLKTSDPSVLSDAVKRKRKIVLSLTSRDLKKFEKIVGTATEKTVTKLIASMAKTAEPTIRECATETAESNRFAHLHLQESIARQWRKPLEAFARFRCLAAHVGELAIGELHRQKMLKTSRLANALALLHARACLVTAEIESLICAGFPDAALARWRTLHEISVTMAFLSERGEPSAERYLDHYVPASLKRLTSTMRIDASSVNGRSIGGCSVHSTPSRQP